MLQLLSLATISISQLETCAEHNLRKFNEPVITKVTSHLAHFRSKKDSVDIYVLVLCRNHSPSGSLEIVVCHPSRRKRNVPDHDIAQAYVHSMLRPIKVFLVSESLIALEEALESSPGSLLVFASCVKSPSPVTAVHLQMPRCKLPCRLLCSLTVALNSEQVIRNRQRGDEKALGCGFRIPLL